MITGYTAIVDHAKLGFPLQAFSELRFDGNTGVDEIAAIAKEMPEVEAVYTIAGDPDALAAARPGRRGPQAGHRPDPSQRKVTGTKTLMVLGTWTRRGSAFTRHQLAEKPSQNSPCGSDRCT